MRWSTLPNLTKIVGSAVGLPQGVTPTMKPPPMHQPTNQLWQRLMTPIVVLTWACAVWAALGGRWATGECVDMSVGGTTLLVPGNAVLTLLLPLHHSHNCLQLSLTEVQVVEAARLAVQKVNEQGILPGVSLGLRVVDTCGLPIYSAKMAAMSWLEDSLVCPQPALTLGILGPGDAASASVVATRVKALGVPVLAYAPRPITATPAIDLLLPAPTHTAQAAVHVLSGVGVSAVSVVHTDDAEGEALAKHFVSSAEYWYLCVAVTVAGSDGSMVAEALRGGPGTVVVVGSRHKVIGLAKGLGHANDIIDLLLVMEGGPLPEGELEGLTIPTIILQRRPIVLPDFLRFLHRDLSSDDEFRRQYLSTVAQCDACTNDYFGYDASVPTTVSAVLSFVSALQVAHKAECGASSGMCPSLYNLEVADWEDLLLTVPPNITTFPELAKTSFQIGDKDTPHYTVSILQNGNFTQVGQADMSSAVLGKVVIPEPRCGSPCSCLTRDQTSFSSSAAANITQSSSGFNIFSGSNWWSWDLPVTGGTNHGEMAVYMTAFCFVLIIFLTSGMICTYNILKPPPRD
ncbi:hypothetical protein Pcinc_032564 [Petrolisthes cinctipes]|uniref:Receptor ligand binding region domain-containing protein n=1 Tax=Petrolisthes cinctipes TaxID=88211 RepID=A0AAE1EU33_PETCI|nr:hypothetical protein Pcinc_032564 [Petrolisthes cinctipes]